ncbi:hypothetical protein VNO77_25161 [Canavalia gladiata]|uniref:Uncharacterized protein n=1 Tax=Canavalia gladiata TaxID=3824 RepID=A0AAN9LB08_CANGL
MKARNSLYTYIVGNIAEATVSLSAATSKGNDPHFPPFPVLPISVLLKDTHYCCSKMAHVLSMVVDGVGGFVKTIWGLQERRWSYTFDVVASAALSLTMTFVMCLLSIRSSHRQRRGDMVFASF